jgi:Lipase (class 3)
MMAFTNEQIMLTLAGLTYRGFADPSAASGHDGRVRAALEAGLNDLAPVQGEWDLLWGPATSRGPRETFDSNVMYVVGHRRDRHRHVVAIRGTNPIVLSDWRLGDFWVTATVPWPYAPATSGVTVSSSTALGLAALQAMQSSPAVTSGAGLASLVGRVIGFVMRTGSATASKLGGPIAELRSMLGPKLTALIETWQAELTRPNGIEAVRRALATMPQPLPSILRPRPRPAPSGDTPVDLVTWLASQASQVVTPLDVTVTGHSKGAALAQAVALWLREALDSPSERWDASRGARVHCYAFAGPTPGNAAFAQRFEAALGDTHHHVRNMHDIVTHAWQPDELRQIPALYGSRTALFKPVVDTIVAATEPLGYRQVQPGVQAMAGPLVASRSFVQEFIHQHLDAYLHELGLDAHGIDALRLFVG